MTPEFTQLLMQALLLTVVGVGMTFASIGALVLGMELMTRFIKDKDEPIAEADSKEEPSAPVAKKNADSDMDGRQLAAIAAVSVALAHLSAYATPQAAAAGMPAEGSGWGTYVRSQQLSARQMHDLRRNVRR